MNRFLALVAALVFLWPPAAGAVTVFAAASLADAMNAAVQRYSGPGLPVRTSYAASSTLARQIENGAPADLFFSADEQWMDYLQQRALILPGSRVSLLGNELVLVAPADRARPVTLRKGFDVAGLLGDGRLAVGDPANVPAGLYAKQALTWLGVWNAAERRLVRAENVRVALAYVERGEAPLGIVYATDAALARGVRVVGRFPSESHEPIHYPLAIVAGHDRSDVRAFMAYLKSGEARKVFSSFGFSAS